MASWWKDLTSCSREIKMRLTTSLSLSPEKRKRFYSDPGDDREMTEGDAKKIRCFYKCDDPDHCVHKGWDNT